MTYQIVEILSDGARRPVPGTRIQRSDLDNAHFTADLLRSIYGGTYAVVEVSE